MGIFKRIVLSSLVVVEAAAAADRPVVAGPDVSDSELKTFVERHDRRTLGEYLEANRPGQDFERRLRAKLESAQRAWLSGSTDSARSDFIELVDLAPLGDWRDPQREAILYAHLRLAQSSATPIERSDWLTKAARLVTDLEPDTSLFPPPLIREFREARAKVATQSTSVVLKDVFPGFRYVLVDGRKFSLDSSAPVRISPGSHRITALSDRHAPLTEQMTGAQLGVFRVKVDPLVESCAAPVKPLDDGLIVEVFGGPKCSPVTAFANGAPNPTWADVPTEVRSKPRRDWLWIGAIALGTAAVIAVQRSQKRSDPTPAHREGF